MDHSLAAYLDDFTRRDWQTLDPEDVDDPVRIAVVGLGWFARAWALPGIARSGFTEATVVTDTDADAVAAVTDDRDVRGVTPAEFRAARSKTRTTRCTSRRRTRPTSSTSRPPPHRGRPSCARSRSRPAWSAPGGSYRCAGTPACG